MASAAVLVSLMTNANVPLLLLWLWPSSPALECYVFLSTPSHWLSVSSRALLTSLRTASRTSFCPLHLPCFALNYILYMGMLCMSVWASHLFICLHEWSVMSGNLKDANLERSDLVIPILLHLIWLHDVIKVCDRINDGGIGCCTRAA